MKDLLLCVYVVAKTLNLEISRCHLADHVKELYESVAARAARLFFLIQSIRSLLYGVVAAVAFAIRELKQARRRRQQKPYKFAYLTMKTSIFARFARAFFIILPFCRRSRSFYDMT